MARDIGGAGARGCTPEVLFLDASDEVLARRYSETRRPHPLGHSGKGIADLIRDDRQALAAMRERASRIIDTTTTTVHELRERVTAAVMGAATGDRMVISIVSFGYKYGAPVGLDLVLDVRFIPNPFFVPELKMLTGLDQAVHDLCDEQAGVATASSMRWAGCSTSSSRSIGARAKVI